MEFDDCYGCKVRQVSLDECSDCGVWMCKRCCNDPTIKCGCYGNCGICHKEVCPSNTGWKCYECKQWLCSECKYLRKKCSECNEEDEDDSQSEDDNDNEK